VTKPKAKAAKKRARAKPDRKPLDDAALEDLCGHLGEGKSLRSWAKRRKYPHRSVINWIIADPDRNKLYRAARQMQADAHIDELIELADAKVPKDADGKTDSALVNDKRLRIDTRKWIASKFHPAMYGEKLELDATIRGRDQAPEDIMAKIVALLGAHGLRLTQATPTEGTPP
jgi:hypothetical protein